MKRIDMQELALRGLILVAGIVSAALALLKGQAQPCRLLHSAPRWARSP